MNLDNDSKNSLKNLFNDLVKKELEEQKQKASHGDLFWARYYNSSKEIRESPVLVISNDNDSEDVIIIQGTTNFDRPDYDVILEIDYTDRNKNKVVAKGAFRTNKIFTIKRTDLDNKCNFNWEENMDKKSEFINKLKLSIGIV